MQLNFVFLTESVNGKGVAVKGEVHRFASLDGKHEDTKQNYSHPISRLSRSRRKTKKTYQEVNQIENSSHLCQIQLG